MLGWIFQPADPHTNQSHWLAIGAFPFSLEKFNSLAGYSVFIVKGSTGRDLAREGGEIRPTQLDFHRASGQVAFAKFAGNPLSLALYGLDHFLAIDYILSECDFLADGFGFVLQDDRAVVDAFGPRREE